MNLIRREQDHEWDPFRQLQTLQDEMSRFFDFSFPRSANRTTGFFDHAWMPAIDVCDTKDSVIVKADVPGISKDDIEVTVEGDRLTIKGEKKEERKAESKDFVREERCYGTFHRVISLPASVDANQVKATYKNGVLELTLPKKEEAKPKQIRVDVN